MIGVSITLSLKGKREEEKFFELFNRAMENIQHVEGLEEIQAAKVLGKDFAYHVFSLWHSEDDIERFLKNPVYHKVIRKQGDELMESFVSYRWQPIREPRKITKTK